MVAGIPKYDSSSTGTYWPDIRLHLVLDSRWAFVISRYGIHGYTDLMEYLGFTRRSIYYSLGGTSASSSQGRVVRFRSVEK